MPKKFMKNDSGKPKTRLVPSSLMKAAGDIFEYGAKKYEPNNWRKGCEWSRYYDALQRHMTDWWEGEDLDTESGMPHLHHIACNVAILIEMAQKEIGDDDRYKPEAKRRKNRPRRKPAR